MSARLVPLFGPAYSRAMNKNTWLVLAFALTACPKAVPVTIAGSDDELVDGYSARLEEWKTKTTERCGDWCDWKKSVCDLSKAICDTSAKKPDRADFQSRCVVGQEECAKFTDNCAGCRK